MNHVLLWENILEDGTLTAGPGSAAGYPVANVLNWRPASPYRWRASGTGSDVFVKTDLGAGVTSTPSAIGVAGHNLVGIGYLGQTPVIRVQHSDDGTAWTTIATLSNTALAYQYAMTTFTGSAHRHWRALIDPLGPTFDGGTPQIGVLTLGRALTFTEGCQPGLDPYGEEAVTDWAMSENGDLLGASFRYRKKLFKMNFANAGLSAADFFATSSGLDFGDFIVHARSNPFWFAWNLTADPAGETYLCRVKSRISMPFMATTLRRGLTVDFEASLP